MKSKFFLFLLFSILMSFNCFAADNVKEMFEQGYGSAEIRTLYFDRDYAGKVTTMADKAIGGSFHYRTAPLHGLSFGLGFYTSNNLDSNDDHSVYGLLAKDSDGDHESFTRLGEYFIQEDWKKTMVRYGAQEINTPFVNQYDYRMAPKTYKGLALVNNSINNLELSLYYLTEFADNADTDYSDIAYSFSKKMENDPLLSAGLKYNINLDKSVSIVPQMWYYTINDGFAFTYANVEIKGKTPIGAFSVKPSYLKQKAIGEKLGGALDTNQYGITANLKTYGFDLSAYYAKTGDDSVVAPWGNSKVIVQQVLASTRAREQAIGAKIGYDFSNIGINGLNFAVSYVNYNTPDSGKYKSYDEAETDYDLIYKVPVKSLKGLSLRARYADINTDEKLKGTDYCDKRLYAVYSFNFGAAPAK